MNLRQILTLYRHEVRSALRERNIVVYSVVLPLVMYPALLWAAFAGISFVQGQSDRMTSRVAHFKVPSAHEALFDSLGAQPRIEMRNWEGTAEDARLAIRDGDLDALIEFGPAPEAGRTLAENFGVTITFNEARDRSANARSRVDGVLTDYRRAWIERSRTELGIDDRTWMDFRVVNEDAATSEDITRLILGLLVPVLMIITVALAAFYPAIDSTAGERERSTWETLMTVAAPRSTVAASKYLYVATFGTMGGLLNLAALTLSLQWILRPLAGDAASEIASTGIPLSALPVIGFGTALLGMFVAAMMLVFAAFAKNFKEGQSMIMPFYLLMIMPAVFLQDPDMEFTAQLAAIPVVNVVMLIRTAIMGQFDPAMVGITLGVMVAVVAVSIAFAQWVMRNEEVLLGTTEGGLGRFLKTRFSARKTEG